VSRRIKERKKNDNLDNVRDRTISEEKDNKTQRTDNTQTAHTQLNERAYVRVPYY